MNKKINPVLKQHSKSFSEWEKKVASIQSTTEKGDAMELLVYFYLKTNKAYYNISEIYLQADIPESLRQKLKLEKNDNGVDAV